MGDTAEQRVAQPLEASPAATVPSGNKSENIPFHTQLEYVSQSQAHGGPAIGHYGQHPYDMSAMASALPPNAAAMGPRSPYMPGEMGQMLSSSSAYQPPPQMAFAGQRGPYPVHPPSFYPPQYGLRQAAQPNVPRQPSFPMQTQLPYSPVDPYAYGLSPAQFSPVDPRFGGPSQLAFAAGFPPDFAQYSRRGSTDAAPIPSFPRGPPRKPKQSGHALWVGNLPPATQVVDLKDHFSAGATHDIESVFLIAKSNCAFVNYRSEAACVAAMNRFHDSRFHGVRLVCRLRRGTATASTSAVADERAEPSPVADSSPVLVEEESPEEPSSPTIARSQSNTSESLADASSGPPADPNAKVPEKYFIVKSLTAQDLEASVRNSTWATQSHNEDALNKAYEQADNVYLIFSANKSGEYFGFARMVSPISGDPVSLSSIPTPVEYGGDSAGSPQSIPTPASSTAPKGRIIDDSARGTIFWEADRDDSSSANPDEGSPVKEASSAASGQDWGRQFRIEWVSTSRLPFYRTRGLRNPWNANREVKIARDGTELEPNIGRRLVQMFLRPPPGPSSGPSVPPTMAYR